jgi:hypothetical protein
LIWHECRDVNDGSGVACAHCWHNGSGTSETETQLVLTVLRIELIAPRPFATTA